MALVRSAQLVASARRTAALGLTQAGPTRLEMGAVAARTAEVAAGMVALTRAQFVASGLDLVLGWGRFVAPRVIEVATATGPRRVTGDRIYLDLGTRAAIPDIPGLHEAGPLTHVEAPKLEVLPTRLLVIDGGYVCMQLAQVFRHLGSEFVVIETGRQLAAREDADVAAAIGDLFNKDGIELAFEARITRVSGHSGTGVAVHLEDGRTFSGSHVLVATGRTPMTGGIGVDIAGVELTERGFVQVDATLRTSVLVSGQVS